MKLTLHGKVTRVEVILPTDAKKEDFDYRSTLTFPDPCKDPESMFSSYLSIVVPGRLLLEQDVKITIESEGDT